MNEIVAKLREYNRWRRGDEGIAQPDPGEIGRLLDAVCEMVDADIIRSKMSTPTPETDNLARGNHVVPTEWAEQLERERDEALIDRANGDIATMTINHYERILRERDMAEDERIDLAQQLRSEQERHAVCQNERDEARESLRILAGLVAYGLGQSGEEWSLEAMRQATTAIQNAKSLEAAK